MATVGNVPAHIATCIALWCDADWHVNIKPLQHDDAGAQCCLYARERMPYQA